MKKKNKIIIFSVLFLLVFLLVSYLVYDYLKYREEIRESYWEIPSFIEYESVDNYEIIDTLEGKKVINENAGLSFMVPEGWNVEKIMEDDIIEISSPDMKREPDIYGGFISEGCIFWVGVDYYLENFIEEDSRVSLILKQVQEEREINEDYQEIIYVNNLSSLKTNRESEKSYFVLVETPINNKIYKFTSYFSLEQDELCLNTFNVFLNKISMNK